VPEKNTFTRKTPPTGKSYGAGCDQARTLRELAKKPVSRSSGRHEFSKISQPSRKLRVYVVENLSFSLIFFSGGVGSEIWVYIYNQQAV